MITHERPPVDGVPRAGAVPAPAEGDAVPGVVRRHRFTIAWELVSCATGGHRLVGRDVAGITAADARLVRPANDGHRWHRCLRCDAWVLLPVPSEPTRPTCPTDDEIEVPLRGRALRDRYVLRLIAVERLLHVIVFLGASIVIALLAHDRGVLDVDFQHAIADLRGGTTVSGSGLVAEVGKLLTFSHRSLVTLALVALGYAVFEAVEAVGLWRGRRWAEYLTFVATAVLLPLEVYGLSERVSALKLITFAVNLAIVAYLLVSKRLFGIRGGPRPG